MVKTDAGCPGQLPWPPADTGRGGPVSSRQQQSPGPPPVLTVVSREGNIGSTTRKDAIMRREIAEKIEISGEPALFQNFPGVAADREYPSLFDGVVAVEREHMWRIRKTTAVNDGLSIVLAGGLEPVDLEQSVSRRKYRRAGFRRRDCSAHRSRRFRAVTGSIIRPTERFQRERADGTGQYTAGGAGRRYPVVRVVRF